MIRVKRNGIKISPHPLPSLDFLIFFLVQCILSECRSVLCKVLALRNLLVHCIAPMSHSGVQTSAKIYPLALLSTSSSYSISHLWIMGLRTTCATTYLRFRFPIVASKHSGISSLAHPFAMPYEIDFFHLPLLVATPNNHPLCSTCSLLLPLVFQHCAAVLVNYSGRIPRAHSLQMGNRSLPRKR